MSPEEKLADIVTRTFNPFKDPNFSQEQIKHGDNPELNEFRDMPFVDPKQPQSVARLLFEGAPF